MKVAIPIFEGTVSPAFDWARRLLVVERPEARGSSGGDPPRGGDPPAAGEAAGHEVELGDLPPAFRARRLAELGVETLLCGGISASLAELLDSQGVKVIAGLAGEVDKVLEAFAAGRLSDPEFAMPGWHCRGRRVRRRRRCGRGGRGGCQGGRRGGRQDDGGRTP